MEEILKYLMALAEARKSGNHDFTCPICGGKATWADSSLNGHVVSKCEQCDMLVKE